MSGQSTPAPQSGVAQQRWASMILLLIGLLVACAVWIIMTPLDKRPNISLQSQLAAVAIVLAAFCVLTGYLIKGRADGILIDDRNRVSLSRVQWSAWLIVLLGGYFTEAVWNVAHNHGFPTMEADLWALLGIASGSAVASNLIVDHKKGDGQDATEKQIGRMDRNATVPEASWADLFLGEEAANRDVVDISRLQQLVITVLLVITYVVLLWGKLEGVTSAALDMPAVTGVVPVPPGTAPVATATGNPDQASHGFLWLLGLSHAAYLAYKSTPKTDSDSRGQGTNTSTTNQSVQQGAATPAPLTAVPVRVAISDVSNVQDLQLLVDGRTVTVPANGFVELSLETNVTKPHVLVATGTRNGQPVSGQLNVQPTMNDLNRAYQLTI